MKIQHKRSAVAIAGKAKEPTAAQTEQGELCVNFSAEDPALFIKDADENIIRVGGDLSLYQKIEDVPSATVVCSPSEIDGLSPPETRGEGSLWWNTEDGILYVWYEDANSSQWVIAVPQGGGAGGDVPPGTTVGTAPPTSPEVGQLWWNSDDTENGGGRLYVYYNDGNSAQWVDTSVPGGIGFSGDYNDLENKPNIPDGFDLEDGSEVNNLIVWRSEGEALTLSISGTDSQHPNNNNITYTDMPTTATSGSGSGMTITYDAGGDQSVSQPKVSFPGSGYAPGDTFTVDGRGFGGMIVDTSSDAGDHPGPGGTSGWYPEAGQDYYVSTRIDSTVNSIPTFASGFNGGRTTDVVKDGAYNYFPVGRRTVNTSAYFSNQTVRFDFRPKDPNYINTQFRLFQKKDDLSTVIRSAYYMVASGHDFSTYDEDGNKDGGVFIKKSEIEFHNINVSDPVTISANNVGSFKVSTPNHAYNFNLKNYNSDLQLLGGDGVVGLNTFASTANGEYGVFHEGNKTVSLKNSLGELRIGTNGNFNFIKEAKTVAIIPNSTTTNITNNGIIEAAAAAVPYSSFDSTNNRRIACYGVNNTPGTSGYSKITGPEANGPQIKGNGIIVLNANLNANGYSINGATFFMATEADDPAAYQTTYSLDENGQQVEDKEYIGATENLLEVIADLRARLAALEGA